MTIDSVDSRCGRSPTANGRIQYHLVLGCGAKRRQIIAKPFVVQDGVFEAIGAGEALDAQIGVK